jgi:hypothetical protein
MLRKRVKFFRNKKAGLTLEQLVKIIFQSVLVVSALIALIGMWTKFGSAKSLSQPERDLQRIAAEVKQMRMPETVEVPIFGEDYDLAMYEKGSTLEPKCNKKACVCLYDGESGATIDCEIFEHISEQGKGIHFITSSLAIGDPKQSGQKEYTVSIVTDTDSIKIS